MTEIELSICCYRSGAFDVMLRHPKTGRELCLSGHQEVTPEEQDMINQLAPACVWTTYKTDQALT